MNMRSAWLVTCVFWCGACGEEEVQGPLVPPGPPATPVNLQALESLDGDCFSPQFPADDTNSQQLSATRQILEFRISRARQMVRLLTDPIREAPTAQTWSREFEGGRVEGVRIAAGEDWWVVKMIATWRDQDDQPGSLHADITLTRDRASFDFGGSELVVRTNTLEFDEYLLGCQPESGRHFAIAPVSAGDQIVAAPVCWPKPSLDHLDPQARAEFEASFALQCLQLVERARSD